MPQFVIKKIQIKTIKGHIVYELYGEGTCSKPCYCSKIALSNVIHYFMRAGAIEDIKKNDFFLIVGHGNYIIHETKKLAQSAT